MPIDAEEQDPSYFNLLHAFSHIRDVLQPHLSSTQIEKMVRDLFAMSEDALDDQIESGRNNVPDDLALWVRDKKLPFDYRSQCVQFYLRVQQLDQSAVSSLSQRRWEELSHWASSHEH